MYPTGVLIQQSGTPHSQNDYYPSGGKRAQGAPGAFSALTTKRFTNQYGYWVSGGWQGIALAVCLGIILGLVVGSAAR